MMLLFLPEWQRDSTCWRVICDETITKLETHTGIDRDSPTGTINFLKLIVKFWKTANVKTVGVDIKFKDPLRAVVRSTCDHKLEFLLKLADIADRMTNSGNKRIQQLTWQLIPDQIFIGKW